MNIAFLGYSKPHTRYNGVATVILQQTQWLEEHGHIVLHYHLFSKEEYKNLSAFLIENKVDLAIWHMTSFKIHLHHKLPCPLICLFHQNPIVKNPKYASTFIEKYQISAFLKKIFEVKFIGNALSYAHYIYCKLFFIYVTAIADKMVLLSSRYVSQFIPAKLFPKKVTAIPNASDMTFLDVRCEKEKNVVFVGRLNNEHKGVDMLLRIWKKVEDRYEDWKLILCGDGPDGESLKNDALCLNLQRVYFQGFTPPRETQEYISKSSILCMTSRTEGFPLVLLDAQRLGCVPIVFNSYLAAEELIDNDVNGILVEPFDEDKYAECLSNLMGDKNKLLAMAQAGIEKSKDYTIDKIMDHWMRLYKEVLDR